MSKAVEKTRSKARVAGRKAPRKKLTSWSYSLWDMHDKCPFQTKCSYLLRLKRKKNKYAARGDEVHESFQHYLEGKATRIHVEAKDWKKKMKALKDKGAVPEEPWGFDKQFKITPWKRAWLRMKLDARVQTGTHLDIIDYKTGNIYAKHAEQGSLYALGGFLWYLDVLTLDVEFWYIDKNEIIRYEYHRDELPNLIEVWSNRAEDIFSDTTFLPRPGKHCDWCSYRKKEGGPCKY